VVSHFKTKQNQGVMSHTNPSTQEDHKFKVSLSYKARPCLQNEKKKKKISAHTVDEWPHVEVLARSLLMVTKPPLKIKIIYYRDAGFESRFSPAET
jgi:hypothetical protein